MTMSTSPEKPPSESGIQNRDPLPEPPVHQQEPPYSAFLPWQKNCTIGLAALAGWFSSVSSFIYFPAIPFLAADLGVGAQQVNLTVTSYLIMSGIFPSVMGDAADRFGRRPTLLVALAVYVGANVGLALQSDFALLFFFRMLQSAGISGTFSVAYGVLGDLFTPAERGGYSGVMAFFLNTPPSLGPVLAGLLLLRWSWRSIFWFLTIASAISLLIMVVFLPETARSIVGNGTSPAQNMVKAPSHLLKPRTQVIEKTTGQEEPRESRKMPNPLTSLKLLRHPDTALIFVSYGINYTVYCCLQASLSTLFVDIYHVSGLVAGLVYLPFGVACAMTALATGRLLDRNFRKTAVETNVPLDNDAAPPVDIRDFPIERARLRGGVKLSVALSAVLVMAYGWLLEARGGVHMAAPLALQFLIGATIQTVFTALNTLLVDVHPGRPSSAQAACNFVRCEMAAACLAGLDVLLGRVGPGWTFLLFGTSLFVVVGLLFVLEARGMRWRQSRLFSQ